MSKEMNNQKGHVLVLPYPAQGHINPLLQFAKRLVLKGVKATLATTPYTIKHINAPSVAVEAVSDGYDEAGFKQAQNQQAYLDSYKSVGSRTLSEIILKYNDSSSPVNCIVYDSMLPWALDVAKQFGIFSAEFLTVSASVCSLYWQIKQGNLNLPLNEEMLPVSMPGLAPLDFDGLPSFIARPDEHPAYLATILEKYDTLEHNDWVFCNTFVELESQLVKAMEGRWPVVAVGPMVPSAYLDQPTQGDKDYGASLWRTSSDKYMRWLDTKPPGSVVYVSFGSMGTTTAKQAEEIALGLKASKKHFLWVVKESEDKLPEQFLKEVGDGGLVVTWCNQVEVLAHRAVGCFVTHCGWNSVLEGLSIGVPMVAVPQWSDQPMNAKFVQEIWGVGFRAERDSEGILTGKELERCIKGVMDGERSEDIRRNAAKWSESAARAASVGGSSDKNVSKFVEVLATSSKEENA